ncbi:hypothetical protein IEQ34_016418 [Dendrobium chrysotoxum]|uniref:Uncharacterized protein n=1 Tax=Dendrobium chrysotoxum TaxID=161865 RepID=A0AAV7GF18_DENCH|nr:hypothetical protein IEQ34_016418 [Dendrobium chrysotoxum]
MAGESSKPPGLSPAGTVKYGDCATNKFIGRLCPKFKLAPPRSPPTPPPRLPRASASVVSTDVRGAAVSSPSARNLRGAVIAAGDAIAPASSCEKERHSDSGSSAKKFETNVIGPGLASATPPRKRLSTVNLSGSDIDGRFAPSSADAAKPRPPPPSAIELYLVGL